MSEMVNILYHLNAAGIWFTVTEEVAEVSHVLRAMISLIIIVVSSVHDRTLDAQKQHK